MRSPLDRLRQALSFEIIALVLAVPLGTVAFGVPLHDVGVVSVVSATIATLWNVVYNFVFDVTYRRLTGKTLKTLIVRIIHSIFFEIGLLIVLMPFIAWYLGVSLWQALVMDLFFVAFYLVYAFAFNWAYDKLFPLPEWRNQPVTR
ncbi:PACE efflux transporter [Roseibium aggregatum]|uniref:PACE efflux transporter n=1 Tax=Roseibium aggregatum TaxID=187304 RepID=UPI001E55D2B6|nr:PACE efflux transporter [Roseibium aggregatum]UES53655.1 PACE efflux transporter [Roseibium aggregatum]